MFDAIGNVTSRSDIAGSYNYDPVRKHAVTAAGGNSYAYDANGNMSTRIGATIAWTSYNLPSSLSAVEQKFCLCIETRSVLDELEQMMSQAIQVNRPKRQWH